MLPELWIDDALDPLRDFFERSRFDFKGPIDCCFLLLLILSGFFMSCALYIKFASPKAISVNTFSIWMIFIIKQKLFVIFYPFAQFGHKININQHKKTLGSYLEIKGFECIINDFFLEFLILVVFKMLLMQQYHKSKSDQKRYS